MSKTQLPDVVVLYGAIGAGKGTQLRILEQSYGGVVIDNGNEFRQFAKTYSTDPSHSNFQRAQRVANDTLHGPIQTEDMFFILKTKIESEIRRGSLLLMDKPGGILPEETEWFFKLLVAKQAQLCFLILHVSLEETIKRAQTRYYVPNSSTPYTSQQEAQSHCTPDQKPYQRPEDQDVRVIQHRYQTMYLDRLAALGALAREYNVQLHTIEAQTSIQDVAQQVSVCITNPANYSIPCLTLPNNL
jgi:adenylate kinase family enzyme